MNDFIKSTEMYKSIFIINFYLRGEFPGFFNFLPVGFLERNDLQAHYGHLAFPLKLSVTNRFYYLSKLAFKHSGYSLLAETMTVQYCHCWVFPVQIYFQKQNIEKRKGAQENNF